MSDTQIRISSDFRQWPIGYPSRGNRVAAPVKETSKSLWRHKWKTAATVGVSLNVGKRANGTSFPTYLRRRDVLGLFLRNGLKLTALGLALGTGVALALARLLRAFLFGVEPTDPGTCVGVAILFAAVALLACFIPAQRATNVDPMTALRHE